MINKEGIEKIYGDIHKIQDGIQRKELFSNIERILREAPLEKNTKEAKAKGIDKAYISEEQIEKIFGKVKEKVSIGLEKETLSSVQNNEDKSSFYNKKGTEIIQDNVYRLKQDEIIQDDLKSAKVNDVAQTQPLHLEMKKIAESVSEKVTMESIEKDWMSSDFVGTGLSPAQPESVGAVRKSLVQKRQDTGWKSWLKNAGEKWKNVGQKIKNFFFLPEEEKLSEVENFDKNAARDLKRQLIKDNRQLRESYIKNSWVAKYPWLKEPLKKIEDAKASVEGFAVGFLIPMVSRVVLHDPLLSQLAGGTTGMFLKFKLSQMYERAYYSYDDISQMVKEKMNQENSVLSVAACSAFLAKLENDKKILGDKVDLAKFNRLKNQINRRLINQIVAAGKNGCGIKILQDKAGNKIIQSSDLVGKLLKKEVRNMMFGMNAEGQEVFASSYSHGLFSSVIANAAMSVVGCSPVDQDHPGKEKHDGQIETPSKAPDIKDIENPNRIMNPFKGSADLYQQHHGHPFDLQEKINTESNHVVAQDTAVHSATVTPTPTENSGSGNHIYTTTDENGHKTYHSEGGYYGVKETDPNANTYNLKPTDPNSNLYHLKDSDPNANDYHLDSKQDVKIQAGYHPFESVGDHDKYHGNLGGEDNGQPGMGGVNKNHDTVYGNTGSDQPTTEHKPVLHHSTEGKKNFDEFLQEKTKYSGSVKPVVGEKPIDASKLFHTEKGLKNFQENWGSHIEGAKNQNNFEFNSDNSGNQPASGEKSNNYDFAPYQSGSKPDSSVQQNNSEFNSVTSGSHQTDQVKTNNFEFAPYQSGKKPETPVQQNDSDFDSYTSSGSHSMDQVKSNNFEFSPYQQDGGQVPDLKENNATFETYQPSTQEKSNNSDFIPNQGE